MRETFPVLALTTINLSRLSLNFQFLGQIQLGSKLHLILVLELMNLK